MATSTPVWHMRCSLSPSCAPSVWPEGTRVTRWHARRAYAVHSLLRDCYAHGGGSVAPYASWRGAFINDSEFDPTSCFLAFRGSGLAGVALCWTSGFVKDLCVAEGDRRQGLGTALLRAVCAHFAARGLSAVELKVEADNSGALCLYTGFGFERI